ncbi:MAG: cupin domain-containing protein [Oculatellaceae cyanobacterium Prado106]|jgi:ribosomal protein L16 Arg81 hydroxylase|nr:cupin domain-containing protein [Oculatellaceae cyanobacterium Prado106]
MKTLAHLIEPLTLTDFFTTYWTQKGLHLSGHSQTDHSQKFQSLFGWQDLNYLLNYHRLTEPDLRFSMQGKSLTTDIDRQNWSDRIRQGATLIVNGIHHRVPKVAQFAAQLRHDIGLETHVNLYCSPAEQQGFDCHYDTHEVFILQIEGEKEWFVYSPTVLHPLPNMASSTQTPPEEPPYLHCVLKPGDVLYIPRGHWHYAIAREQPSLHLTVGLECQTGLDWLGWLVDQLQQNPAWRQTLPTALNGETTALQQHLLSLRDNLVEVLFQAEQVDPYLDALQLRYQPSLRVDLPAQLGSDLFPDGFQTVYHWSTLHRLTLQLLGQEHYQLRIGTKQIDLKGIPAPLAEYLFNRDRFSLLDIADCSPDLDLEADLAPLLHRLITESVLYIGEPAQV